MEENKAGWLGRTIIQNTVRIIGRQKRQTRRVEQLGNCWTKLRRKSKQIGLGRRSNHYLTYRRTNMAWNITPASSPGSHSPPSSPPSPSPFPTPPEDGKPEKHLSLNEILSHPFFSDVSQSLPKKKIATPCPSPTKNDSYGGTDPILRLNARRFYTFKHLENFDKNLNYCQTTSMPCRDAK